MRDRSTEIAMLITDFSRVVWSPWYIMNRKFSYRSDDKYQQHCCRLPSVLPACTSLFNQKALCTHGNGVSTMKGFWHCFWKTNSWRASSFSVVFWEKKQLLSNCRSAQRESAQMIFLGRLWLATMSLWLKWEWTIQASFPISKSSGQQLWDLQPPPKALFSQVGAFHPCCGIQSCACF